MECRMYVEAEVGKKVGSALRTKPVSRRNSSVDALVKTKTCRTAGVLVWSWAQNPVAGERAESRL